MKNLVSGLVASVALCLANPFESYSQYYDSDPKAVDVLLHENSSQKNTLEENIDFVLGYTDNAKKDSIGSEGFSLVKNKDSYDFHYEVPFDSGIVNFKVRDYGSGPGYDGLGSSNLFRKDTIFYGPKNESFALDGFLLKDYSDLYDLIWNDAANLIFKEKVNEFNPKFAEDFGSQ